MVFKNHNFEHTQEILYRQKHIYRFGIIAFLLMQFIPVFSQKDCLSKQIIIEEQDVTVVQLLEQVSKQCGCFFSYPTDIIQKTSTNHNEYYKGSVESYVHRLFGDSIEISTFKNQIILGEHETSELPSSSPDSIVVIKGIILDSSSNDVVPFSSVAIRGSFLGTVANMNGRFELKVPSNSKDSLLQVSALGYYTGSRSISSFLQDSVLYLAKSNVSLKEVMVRSSGANELIKVIRENVRESFRTDVYSYQAFYREHSSKNSDCLSYSEALFKGRSSSMVRVKNDKLVLQKARDFRKNDSDTVLLKLKGGVEAALKLDIASGMAGSFLDYSSEDEYDYSISDIKLWGDNIVYVISFSPKRESDVAMFAGELYVSLDSLVVKGATFQYTPEMLEELKDDLVYKKKMQIRVKPVSYIYRVEYKQFGDKYSLWYARGDIRYKVKPNRKLKYTDYSTSFEMVITDIDTVNVDKPKRQELFETSNIFTENIKYSPHYWYRDNVIIPEQEIMEAFRKSGFTVTVQE